MRFGSFLAMLSCVVVGLVACSDEEPVAVSSAELGEPSAEFPRSFVFGAATAGFQNDMGCTSIAPERCEDRASDWYQWITTPRILDNPLLFMSKDPPSKGPGFFEHYESDLDLVAGRGEDGLGAGAVRLSIEWSRIFPTPTWGIEGQTALRDVASKEGLAFYHRVFAAMRARGLQPFVTVNHYTLPIWVHDGNRCNESLDRCIAEGKGGWADPNRARIVHEIAKYAGFVAAEYGGEGDRWATLNEPFSAIVVAGYIVSSSMRSNPPGLTGPWMRVDAAKTASVALIEAHARMYDAIKAADRSDADGDGRPSEVGIVNPFSEILPASSSADDQRAAADARYFFEDLFMDGVVLGRVDERWDAAPGTAPVRPDLAGRVDFIGLNYYFRFRAKHVPLGDVVLGFLSPHMTFDMLAPFEAEPRGIHAAIMRAARYGKPIYVTETGTGQDDETRGAAWMVKTLREVRRAMNDGADVRGYFPWTLTDNYEWNIGAKMHMGLYAVDPVTKARRIREAGRAYGTMAKARAVPASLEARYAD